MTLNEAVEVYTNNRDYLETDRVTLDDARAVIADAIVERVGDDDWSGQIYLYRGAMLHTLPAIGDVINKMSWTDACTAALAFARGDDGYLVYTDADDRPYKVIYQGKCPRLCIAVEGLYDSECSYGQPEGEILVHPSETATVTGVEYDDDLEIYRVDVEF